MSANIPTTKSVIGDTVEFDKLVKYNGYNPSYAAQGLPLCEYRHIIGTVTGRIAWADNSTEVEILTTDGDTVTEQVERPHGDVCF